MDDTKDKTITRRSFLTTTRSAIALVGIGAATGKWTRLKDPINVNSQANEALKVLGHKQLRHPGSLPDPSLPAGSDTMPKIGQIVVLMMENHSYDNILGMLGREHGRHLRGDGFSVKEGAPIAANPYPNGKLQHSFHMPTTCQLPSEPSQEWAASHIAYNNGYNNGFVIASGGVAMGYWTDQDLPFTYDLASRFPIGDRWFCSVLGQTDPNRRYLIAGTSTGMTDDAGTGTGNVIPDASLALPANGTIFNLLDSYGISWANYVYSFPNGATPELYATDDSATETIHKKPFNKFFSDAKAGTLPAFSLLDPSYKTQSQENPQNMVLGETMLSQVVQALGDSILWKSTLLIVVYDEHGGYYDHVPPPPALAPDAIAPIVQPGESTYDGFNRYGFRVPAIVVSPYAKKRFVSHVVYDHTSVLAMVEKKWNLPALTYRDANANDLSDFLDLEAMRKGRYVFPELPHLASPNNSPSALRCSTSGPGFIPPPRSTSSNTAQKDN